MHVPVCVALWGFDADTWWITPLVLAALVALAYVFRYQVLVRFPLWLLRHTLYRVHVHGLENIPREGPALLVSNHVSHIDALLILAAQKRKVRFIVWAPFLGVPFLRWILRLMRVIPIDSRSGPRAIIQALRAAGEALAKGEVVCIFAEGGITRTGFMLPFNRGLEQIIKNVNASPTREQGTVNTSPTRERGTVNDKHVPIVPVCLDHLWGSIFSFQAGKFFWKWPKRIPYHVYVSFGKPLPATASSFEVRQAIQKLSADSAIRRADKRRLVHRQFVRMACRHPFRPCLIDENAAKPILKYGETLVAAKLLTKRLRKVLKEDAMVGVWLPPSAGGALANICLAFLGKSSVNLNYSASQDIVRSSIRLCNIRIVLTSRLFTHKMPLDPGPGVELFYLEDCRKDITKWERIRTFLGVLLLPGYVQERWLLRLGRHKPADVATIIFSSGSTGDPKGIVLTHANIAANVESVVQAVDPTPRDRLLGILPFFHSFGYTVTLWVPLQVGASCIYYPNPLQPREIGDLCKKYACTIFLSTPTFLRTYLRRCEPDDFKSARILMCGAEKLPRALAKEFEERFGVAPLEGYGCTELSPVVSANVPDWQQGSLRQIGNKPGTIGHPLPGIAVRVVHPETLEDLPLGQEGMLLVYGANVMKGYLNRDDLTKKKIVQGGWYITGDLATLDEDGFITITGRQERFAKVAGEMVPLEKVEDEIHAVLGTNERAVAVTAVPDSKRGERVVVLHLGLSMSPQEIGKKLAERGLPNIYIPGPRDFLPATEIPVLGSGKLDLKKCKELSLALAGKGE